VSQEKKTNLLGELFDLLPDPVLVFKKMNIGLIVFSQINRSGLKTFGKNILEYIGKDLSSLEHILPELSSNIELVMNSEIIVTDKITIKINDSIDDRTFVVDYIQANSNTVLVMPKDLTEIEKMQKEMQSQEELSYQQVAEYSPLGIINLNANGTVIFANPTSTQLFGWINEQVTLVEGRNIFEFPFISDQERIIQGISDLLKGDPLVGIEFPVTIKNQQRILKAYGSPRYRSNGSLAGAILMYTDITELKQIEENLKRQKEELSDFAHQMSHDLGNSITGILGYAEFMKKYSDYSHLDEIIKHANKMTELLQQSLVLADSGLLIKEKEKVDLNSLVDNVAELIIPKEITYSRTKLPIVLGDHTKLTQVFENIIRNAIIHGKPNEITMTDKLSVKRKKKGILISITNDGKPINQKHRKKLFTRGFSSREGRKGLGMYIVKRLVEAHGWSISLGRNKKTTFKIFIPN